MTDSRQLGVSAPGGTFPRMISQDMPRPAGMIGSDTELYFGQCRGPVHAGSTMLPTQRPAVPLCSVKPTATATSPVCPAPLASSVHNAVVSGLPSHSDCEHVPHLSVSDSTSTLIQHSISLPSSSHHHQSADEAADKKVVLCTEVSVSAGQCSTVKDELVLSEQSDKLEDRGVDGGIPAVLKQEPDVKQEPSSVTAVDTDMKTEQLKHDIKSELTEDGDEADMREMKLSDTAVADVKKEATRKGTFYVLFVCMF